MKWTVYGRKLLPLLLLLAPCCLPVTGSAETVYTVNESQMEIWTKSLYKLKMDNETLQNQLAMQSEQLTLLETQLTDSKTAIQAAEASQKKAQASLTSLNNSWQIYKEQSEATESRLKRQRAAWAIIAAIAAGWAASHT